MRPPAKITLCNQSGDIIRLIHTNSSNAGADNVLSGKSSYWTTQLPSAGTTIKNGESLDIGIIDSIILFESTTWLYFTYNNDPTVKIQIYVQMKTDGVWVSVGLYNSASNDDNPMPYGNRMELVTYDFTTNPTSNIVYAPPSNSWSTKVPAPTVDRSSEVSSGIINMFLATAITACFVIPSPVSAIAAGVEAVSLLAQLRTIYSATSTAHKLAVALTAAQGMYGMMNTFEGKKLREKAFGAIEAFETNTLSMHEWQKSELRMQMQDTTAWYTNPQTGYNVLLTSIAKRVNQQLPGKVVFDDALVADTIRCFDFYETITASNSNFQKALTSCLNMDTLTSSGLTPPDKIALALGIAAISMTINAYCNGFLLRTFVLTDENNWTSQKIPHVDKYDAEHLIDYMYARKELVDKLDLFAVAKAERLRNIAVSSTSTTETTLIGESSFSSSTITHCILADQGLQQASWGPGDVASADALMKQYNFSAVDEYKDGVPYKWQISPCRRDKMANTVYTAYSKYVSDNVCEDVKQLQEKPMKEIENSCIPYMAYLRRPHAPTQAPEVSTFSYSNSPVGMTTPDLFFKFVQYGYSFANAQGVEGDILWQQWPPSQLKFDTVVIAGKTEFYCPTGCKIHFAKDPWNIKAEDLAQQANSKKLEGSEVRKKILPPYTSALRVLYRRYFSHIEATEPIENLATMEQIGALSNDNAGDYEDNWLEEAVLSPPRI
ncbi:hypothetical protein K7432_015217 [Basidiobolus ranarum]|uniref:Uncharacterized protein n=1 Tax=Basidiobolus ranarum TaxID=34480 RepID=A0ABR2WGH6_9FUNG